MELSRMVLAVIEFAKSGRALIFLDTRSAASSCLRLVFGLYLGRSVLYMSRLESGKISLRAVRVAAQTIML